MKSLGKFLAIIGLLLLFLYPPAGVGCIFIGLIMFAIGKPSSTIEAEKRKSQEMPCPFCKEPILKNAVKCKHCQSAIPVTEEKYQNTLTKKKKSKGDLILLAIFVVIVGYGLIEIGMHKDKSSDNTSPSETLSTTTPSQSVGMGEIGQLDNGKGMVNLAIDEESHSKMLDAVNAKDQSGYNELVLAGKVFLVNCPIKVRVIDETIFMKRVRILEGPQKDLAGWCPFEYVKR